jgi:hypothetical protein
MQSPFPGMDPYLEDDRFWPLFQHLLVSAVCQTLFPALDPRYRPAVGVRRYAVVGGPAAPAEPVERKEEFVEIRTPDGRLVTLLDVVSPANKTTPEGREAYLATRALAKAAGANLVEIDLVLQGQPTWEYNRDGLPAWDYAVTVTRASQPERHEIYSATLQKRLPRFRLPLDADDRDTVLDLTVLFGHCYAAGRFAEQIDYRQEPAAALGGDALRRVADLLPEHGLRDPTAVEAEPGLVGDPAYEEVARAAYQLWQAQGCPHGRDKEHWFRAIELVKQRRGAE